MHFYCLTRGIKHEVDRTMNELSCKYVPMNTSEGKKLVQVAVRPVQLWEIVAPEESMPVVLKTLRPVAYRKFDRLLLAPLRKILRCRKMKKSDDDTEERLPMYRSTWVDMIPIGIKKDKFDENGNELL